MFRDELLVSGSVVTCSDLKMGSEALKRELH